MFPPNQMIRLAQCDARPTSNCRNAKWVCCGESGAMQQTRQAWRHRGPREGRNQGAGKGDEGQDRTVRRAAFPRFPLRGLGSRSSRDSSSRQTVRASFRSTHTANQRPEIEQLEIPAQGFAPSPFEAGGGPWQDQPVELQVQTWDPGAPPSDLQKCTFRPSMPLFLFLLPSPWVSASAQVCNRHLPPRKIQAVPKQNQTTPGIQAPKAPKLEATRTQGVFVCLQWAVGAGTLSHPFSPLLLIPSSLSSSTAPSCCPPSMT